MRAGDWVTLLTPYHVPAPYRTTYRVSVWRARDPRRAQLYPITLRQRIPTIKIPLREGEADAVLDLQPLIERAYHMGRYDRIDYSKPCDPPLEGEDEQWARALLKKP